MGIAALRQVGISSKSALKVGDSYTITYYPNRDGTPGGFMSKMILPDGRSFDTKNTDPTAVPDDPIAALLSNVDSLAGLSRGRPDRISL